MATVLPLATHLGCYEEHLAVLHGVAADVANLYREPFDGVVECDTSFITPSWMETQLTSGLYTWWNFQQDTIDPGRIVPHAADWGPSTWPLAPGTAFHMLCYVELQIVVSTAAPRMYDRCVSYGEWGDCDHAIVSPELFTSMVTSSVAAWWAAGIGPWPSDFPSFHTRANHGNWVPQP